MTAYDTWIVVGIAIVIGLLLITTGILIQWSLRKRRRTPKAAPDERIAREAPETKPQLPPEIEMRPPPEPEAPPAAEPPVAEVVKPEAEAEIEAPKVEAPGREAPKPAPVRAPIGIGGGLRKTRENFLVRIRAAISGAKKADEIYEGLLEALIAADVGVDASVKLTDAVRARLGSDNRPEVIRDALKEEIAAMLAGAERPAAQVAEGPLVILLVGVNGVGKTTTVAKLAAWMKTRRGDVIIAAADTFRAAAIEQLEVWCNRVGADIIKHQQGSDPAAVAFDSVRAGVARKTSTVIIDTAGRLQTKTNLMEELKKIARVAGRELPGAPHETWLVLDANTGQNALSQAKIFGDAVPLTGVVLAKLDSTAKGGIIIAVADRLKVPVRFVGVGESAEDLEQFDARAFIEALFTPAEGAADAASDTYAA